MTQKLKNERNYKESTRVCLGHTTNAFPALKSAFLLSISCSNLSIFSCLFLFFHARKDSRVILVTFGPRAERCKDKESKFFPKSP